MLEDNTLFLVNCKNNYFYKYENECVQPMKSGKINIFTYLVFKKLGLKFPKFLLDKKIIDFIGNNGQVVITDSAYSDSLLNSLNSWGVHCKLYYMNKIDEKNIEFLDKFDNNHVYTFSKVDSEIYSINYLNTPYSSNIKLISSPIMYDVVFLGREKNRKNEIERVYKTLNSMNLRCNFMVLDSTSEISEIKLDDYIDYDKYIEYVSKSKCIVELLNTGQEARSLRGLESVFLKKKLITNCKNIVNEPFYDKNNIFILGVDSISNLSSFISEPYKDVSKRLYEQYDFEKWIRNFE